MLERINQSPARGGTFELTYMPHGFLTIEQWIPGKRAAKGQWSAILHLEAGATLSDAIEVLESLGKPGFFRIVQTQRMIWAEMEGGKLRLRRSHAMSPESLARTAQAFERDGGRYPVEKARAERAKQKKAMLAKGKKSARK